MIIIVLLFLKAFNYDEYSSGSMNIMQVNGEDPLVYPSIIQLFAVVDDYYDVETTCGFVGVMKRICAWIDVGHTRG